MAVLETIWVRGAGAQGLKDGTSLADAYGLDPNVADDVWTALGLLPALTNDLEIKICGGGTIGAAIVVSLSASTLYRITLQGRNAGDTADEEVAIDANGGAFTVIAFSLSQRWRLIDVRATNTNEASGNNGFTLNTSADGFTFIRCRADGCYDGFLSAIGSINHHYIDCQAHDNTLYGWDSYSGGNRSVHCVSHDNGYGFSTQTCVDCVAYGNTNEGFSYHSLAVNCTSYNNGTSGFHNNRTSDICLNVDCIAVGNAGYGYGVSDVKSTILMRCGGILNTSGRARTGLGIWRDIDDPGLTADPFINAAAGNFALNNAAGGGRLCRNNAGILIPGGLSKAYLDIGAIQTLRAPAITQGLQDLTGGVLAS